MAILRSARCRALAVAILAIAISACDLKDPVVITYDQSDPGMLLVGARRYFGEGWNFALLVDHVASDEASDPLRFLGDTDETGDPSDQGFYNIALEGMTHARELARMAIERAQDTGEPAILRHAYAYHGWIVVELGRRWEDQPLVPLGRVHTLPEIYLAATESFTKAIDFSADTLANDSINQWALAGNAWTYWELGKELDDSEYLDLAVDHAKHLLTVNPGFIFTPQLTGPFMAQAMAGTILPPNPDFATIPYFWAANPLAGPKLMDADGLRLILADIHLRRGDLPEAKSVLEEVELLAENHLGLGERAPSGAPLSEDEVRDYLDSLDADGVRHAIDELWRENFFLQGRRNVGPNGKLYPYKLPDYS